MPLGQIPGVSAAAPPPAPDLTPGSEEQGKKVFKTSTSKEVGKDKIIPDLR
jgi:hypothetical protein